MVSFRMKKPFLFKYSGKDSTFAVKKDDLSVDFCLNSQPIYHGVLFHHYEAIGTLSIEMVPMKEDVVFIDMKNGTITSTFFNGAYYRVDSDDILVDIPKFGINIGFIKNKKTWKYDLIISDMEKSDTYNEDCVGVYSFENLHTELQEEEVV